MDEPSYFQNALSNFVTDAACGGAIRHLVDIGYTLEQIVDRLDYPAPREKVRRIMMDYLYESRVLLREEPSAELFAAKETFVQEQDAFGRRSMRKIIVDSDSQKKAAGVSVSSYGPGNQEAAVCKTEAGRLKQGEEAEQKILWKEALYEPGRDGKLTELLYRKCRQNGETYSYVSCLFGESRIDHFSQHEKDGQHEERDQAEKEISGGMCDAAEDKWNCLNNRQRDYIQGIRWDQPVMYHRLNQRMLEIIGKLYEAGAYGGAAFFAASREKITIPQKRVSA